MSAETVDEVERLRASIANREEVIGELRAEVKRLADTLGSIGRYVSAESCERDVILDAIDEAYDVARREGAEAMREAAALVCERAGVWGSAAEVRALQLTPQPSQSHAASETPEAPSAFADAAARARDAARGRVASEVTVAPDAWVESWTDTGPRGLRVIRKTLATVAGERWQAKRLCDDAGIRRERVDMGGSSLSMWHAIIDEAVKVGRLNALVAAAREEFPRCGL